MTCWGCKQELPIDDFHKDKGKKSGYQSKCKKCQYARYLERLAVDPDKVRRIARESAQRNRKRQLYGITNEEFSALIEVQGGLCAICRRVPSEKTGTSGGFVVDHDHQTGRVRGALCHNCNRALGLLGDSRVALMSAMHYLNEPSRSANDEQWEAKVAVRRAGGWLPGDLRVKPSSLGDAAGFEDLIRSFGAVSRQADPACWSWPVPLPDAVTWLVAAEGYPADRLVGMADDEFTETLLSVWQDDHCASCGGGTSKRLVCDHDHETGLVRGLLCQSCNLREPGAEEGTTLDKYRKRTPLDVLGRKPYEYVHPLGFPSVTR